MIVARRRVVFGAARILDVPVLLRKSVTNRGLKQSFPPEHKIVRYKSVLVPIFSTVNQTKNDDDQGLRESDNYEEATILEDV